MKKKVSDIDEVFDKPVAPLPASIVGDSEDTFETVFHGSKPAWKPDLAELEDAVIDGNLKVDVGGAVLIQYSDVWRDSAYFVINKIDYETGIIRLWNPHRSQYAQHNFRATDCAMKLPGKDRKWVPGAPDGMMTRKRGRRTSLKKLATKPVVMGPDGLPMKRKRGRPPGAKNKIQSTPKQKIARVGKKSGRPKHTIA
jgi:hypothetical protein